jgi:hypothetical protein
MSPAAVKTTRSQMLITRSAARSRLCAAHSRWVPDRECAALARDLAPPSTSTAATAPSTSGTTGWTCTILPAWTSTAMAGAISSTRGLPGIVGRRLITSTATSDARTLRRRRCTARPEGLLTPGCQRCALQCRPGQRARGPGLHQLHRASWPRARRGKNSCPQGVACCTSSRASASSWSSSCRLKCSPRKNTPSICCALRMSSSGSARSSTIDAALPTAMVPSR